jgi:hypothetical protein
VRQRGSRGIGGAIVIELFTQLISLQMISLRISIYTGFVFGVNSFKSSGAPIYHNSAVCSSNPLVHNRKDL